MTNNNYNFIQKGKTKIAKVICIGIIFKTYRENRVRQSSGKIAQSLKRIQWEEPNGYHF